MFEKQQWRKWTIILGLSFVFGFFSSNIYAAGQDYPDSAMNLPPLEIFENGELRSITIGDIYDFHGGACPGATMGFQAARYGLELLYGDETPVIEDMVILSRSAGGPMDLFDMVMKGGGHANRTWPPAGIEMGAENFEFQFLRKSTMQAVNIRLQDGLWPGDWFELKGKHKAGTITEAESEKRKVDRQYIISEFPKKSFQELFGTPEACTFIAWGHIEQGEMDRLIRVQRRGAKD